MKKTLFFLVIAFASATIYSSCGKKKNDVIYTSPLTPQVVKPISDAAPLAGAYSGHMITGKIYTVKADSNIFVNVGDTLFMDAGSKLYMSPHSSIVVKGTFISLGTQAQPNWITVNGITKTDDPSVPAGSDSAYTSSRLWCGINCDTSCRLLVLKWTHIEYTSAAFVGTPPLTSVSGTSHAIFFQTPGGTFDIEDCWLYGSQDEVRVAGGNICAMRNTMEKFGLTGGDGFNMKHGTVGDLAYNLFVGVATSGTKASDKGTYTGPQTNVNIYNNTYVNCGFRKNSSGKGGSINYEEGAGGRAYNNIIVNCKIGLRVVNSPIADTAHLRYGYTFNYGDSEYVVDQFYPQNYITVPQSTDIPDPSTYLPTGYTLGQVYTAPSMIGINNPQFVNYPLPAPAIVNIAYTSGFDFHLKLTSPAVNKGFKAFSPLAVVPIDPVYGASEITPPGKDLGCYQSDGITGNQH